jgi:hypothetical protein
MHMRARRQALHSEALGRGVPSRRTISQPRIEPPQTSPQTVHTNQGHAAQNRAFLGRTGERPQRGWQFGPPPAWHPNDLCNAVALPDGNWAPSACHPNDLCNTVVIRRHVNAPGRFVPFRPRTHRPHPQAVPTNLATPRKIGNPRTTIRTVFLRRGMRLCVTHTPRISARLL